MERNFCQYHHLVINNKLEPDFKRKADHFNNFFASKCTSVKTDIVLPTLLEHESEARFSKITFTYDQILEILSTLCSDRGPWKCFCRI